MRNNYDMVLASNAFTDQLTPVESKMQREFLQGETRKAD